MRGDVTPPRTHPPLLDYAKHKQRSNKGNCAGGVIPHAGNTSPTSPPPLFQLPSTPPLASTARTPASHDTAPQDSATAATQRWQAGQRMHHPTSSGRGAPSRPSGSCRAPLRLSRRSGCRVRALTPTTEQTGRLDAILVQIGADRRKAGTDQSGRGHAEEDEPFCRRQFLETKGINPEIPAADQEVRIEKLLDKLEKEKAAATLHHRRPWRRCWMLRGSTRRCQRSSLAMSSRQGHRSCDELPPRCPG